MDFFYHTFLFILRFENLRFSLSNFVRIEELRMFVKLVLVNLRKVVTIRAVYLALFTSVIMNFLNQRDFLGKYKYEYY